MKNPLIAQLAAALVVAATAAQAQEPIRIGFISTMSGPQGVLGQELANGFKLGLEATGQRLGGRPSACRIAHCPVRPRPLQREAVLPGVLRGGQPARAGLYSSGPPRPGRRSCCL